MAQLPGILLSCVVLTLLFLPPHHWVHSFLINTSPPSFVCRQHTLFTPIQNSATTLFALNPSQVSSDDDDDDDDDPTSSSNNNSNNSKLPPSFTSDPISTIDPSSIPELHYDPKAHPIPDQPWRRGDTDGCEDPISIPWRVEAEQLIQKAISVTGATLHDITWYMSHCIITIDDIDNVEEGIVDGPPIEIDMGEDYDEHGTGQDYFWNPAMEDEEFDEYQITHPPSGIDFVDIEDGDYESDPRATLDTSKLSAVAKTVLDALRDPYVEEQLEVVSRHEISFAAPPTDPRLVSTQKQFDGARGELVTVETRDPWKSNRTLKGKLVSRNALDVILNVKGRMVTIPNNFVYQVMLLNVERESSTESVEVVEEETVN